MQDRSGSIWNLLLQQLKHYLQYQNVYGHQIWQGDDLPPKGPTDKITRPFDHVVLRQTKIIITSLPERLYHQTLQDGNLLQWASTYKVTGLFHHVLLRDHVTN